MKGFYHIWAWRPSWSCDLDFLYTHWFPLPIDASYKIWLWLAKRFQRRRSMKLWTDGRTTDGRMPDHGHPISSPCEPNGSGELKIAKQKFLNTICCILNILFRSRKPLFFHRQLQFILTLDSISVLKTEKRSSKKSMLMRWANLQYKFTIQVYSFM